MTKVTSAIILAAGRSERLGGGDKLLQPLAGRPLLAHSLATFAAFPGVDSLVVVASEANRGAVEALVSTAAPDARVVLGGERRRDSVAAGLAALPESDYVIVHDGARPLVTSELIESALMCAGEASAAICAVPVNDTVKRSDGSGYVRGTISRADLWLVQTPQAFDVALLHRAHAEVEGDATDDAALVEALGAPIRIVPGSTRNLKITTKDDLALAEALLALSPGAS